MSTASVSPNVKPHVTQALLKAGGVAGMLVLPVFAATVILLTWAEWGFLHGIGWTVLHPHDVNYPSGLARGRFGFVQSLNFAVLGLLIIVFGWSLSTQFTHRVPGIVALLGLSAAAAGGLLSAFPTDL